MLSELGSVALSVEDFFFRDYVWRIGTTSYKSILALLGGFQFERDGVPLDLYGVEDLTPYSKFPITPLGLYYMF